MSVIFASAAAIRSRNGPQTSTLGRSNAVRLSHIAAVGWQCCRGLIVRVWLRGEKQLILSRVSRVGGGTGLGSLYDVPDATQHATLFQSVDLEIPTSASALVGAHTSFLPTCIYLLEPAPSSTGAALLTHSSLTLASVQPIAFPAF